MKMTDRNINNFKPSNVSRDQLYTTKAERDEKLRNKRTRLDSDSVEGMILRAFKKHQYISQKHLVAITAQPEVIQTKIWKSVVLIFAVFYL